MKLSQLKEQLADLKKKEVVAQTRESLLNEEKQKLLVEVNSLLNQVRELGIIPEEELSPSNLPNVVQKLQSHIETELSQANLPQELN